MIHFLSTGVYISKTSYIRQGEESLDGFYRAWHHVEYYRYIFECSLYLLWVVTKPQMTFLTVTTLLPQVPPLLPWWPCHHADHPWGAFVRCSPFAYQEHQVHLIFSLNSAGPIESIKDWQLFHCFISQNGFSSARSLPSLTGDRQSNQSFCCCLQEKRWGKEMFEAFEGWEMNR